MKNKSNKDCKSNCSGGKSKGKSKKTMNLGHAIAINTQHTQIRSAIVRRPK